MSLRSYAAKWKKQIAVVLTIALTGNMGVIVPLAGSKDDVKQTIEEVAELPQNIQNQKVKLGTKKAELKLPESLKVRIEPQEEKTELYRIKASDSDAKQDASDNDKADDADNSTNELWRNVLVSWSLAEADNGLDAYDGDTPGVYTFEAELKDQRFEAENSLLPTITVEVEKEVSENETNDEEFFMGEIVDLGEIEISSLISTYGLEDGTVDLAKGNHVKWIDRIVVPDYAKKYYQMLEEGSDNDGNNDWLIEDKYFSKAEAITLDKYIFNGCSVELSSNLDWYNNSDEWSYVCKCIWTAYSAFTRDHPEVFWLARAGQLTYTKQKNAKGGYDYTVYYLNKVHEAEGVDPYDVRDEVYQGKNEIKNAIKRRDEAVNTIMKSVSSDDVVDQIIGYNDWLTHNNQYCSTYPEIGGLSYKSITALVGSIGSEGPVCTGYACAFKVLCDKAGIPCVLVDGFPYDKTEDPGHMWNYVKVEGEWYAVDVTWNDPFDNSKDAAISGHESNYWTLLGSKTLVRNGDDGKDYTFIQSHPVNNNPGSFRFPNGPELSEERYPIVRPVVEFSETEQREIYTGQAPEVKKAPTVKLEDGSVVQNPKISYSYAVAENGKYTDGLPIDAGTYFIRAAVASSKADGYRAANSSNTLKLIIEKAPRSIPAPMVKDKTDASVTLNPVVSFPGANDGTVEYAWNTVNSVPDSGWQKNPVITGLHRNRTYYFFSRITGGKNYQDAVSASGTEGKTDKTKLPKPTLKKSMYAYTSAAVTAEINDFDGSIMGITGQSATERGNYQAEVTLSNEDFTWADGSSAPVVLNWKIMLGRTLTPLTADKENITENRVALNSANAAPAGSITDGVLEYGFAAEDDSIQVKNWQAGTEFTGLESGTTYYFFARITGGTEYIDVISAALPLTTKKIKLEKPVLSDNGSYVYNGSLIQASIRGFRSEEMTVRDNAFRNAGNYTANISLKDTKHYSWEDETSEPVSLSWKITKKPVTVKAANKSKYYGEENPALTLEKLQEGILAGNDKESDLKVTLTTTAEKNSTAGSYPITGNAAEDSNYEVTVEPGTLTISRRSSGGGGGGGGSRTTGSDTTGGPGSSLPSYVVKGEWSMLNGFWHFSDASGNACINNWVAAYNPNAASDQQNYDWFRFDPFGNMLTGWFMDSDGSWYYLNPVSDGTLGKMLTGWVWIADETGVQRCYYLNPNSDGYRGKMLTNTVVDGYTIDANGWWTVDGIVQVE